MAPKIKNVLIFVAIAIIFVLLYIFFIRKTSDQASLISSTSSSANLVLPSTNKTGNQNSSITKDFLSLLLNVKNIKLDDSIFSNIGFANLRDSSITLTPDGNEGRPNPFAPLGAENVKP